MTYKDIPAELTREQKSVLTGVILTDATVNAARTSRQNTQIQFEQSKTVHAEIFYAYLETLQPFIKQTPREAKKDAPKKGGAPGERTEKKYRNLQVWTVRTPALTKFCKDFVNENYKKTIPSIEFLYENLDWQAFAWMLMCDGSAHNPGRSQGMKLHLQNFSYDQQTKLCLFFYYKFGIKCWPSFHKLTKDGTKQYHIRISGQSLKVIRKKALPFMVPQTHGKVPLLLPQGGTLDPQHLWLEWYKTAKIY